MFMAFASLSLDLKRRKKSIKFLRDWISLLFQNGFDSGARFDGIAQPTIPPPPPGVGPNAAQLAAASGAQVSMSQKKGSFLSGGSGGGFTFW